MSNKILISTSTFGAFDSTPLDKLKQAGFKVKLNPYKRKLSKEELLDLLPGVNGLIAGLETLDHDVLSRSELKVISRCGTGISNVDLKAAQEFEIKVCNTPDGPTNAVAELTLGCLLNLLRRTSQMDQDMRQGQWIKQTGLELQGKTIVIIGFGRIGRRVAELLGPFGVRIIGVDPFMQESDSKYEFLGLEAALPIADIVTLHCSGEDCLLGHKEFGLMKKGVFVLNAARGSLVNEEALLEALDDHHVSGVWMDTFDEEPYTGRLTQYRQALLTPHVGSYSLEGRKRMELQAVENLIANFKVEVH